MAAIDINADIGEGCGEDAGLLAVISSCSIDCGGHAGDVNTMAQVTALADIAAELGASLQHVKPHGALYNDAIADAKLADIVARVTAETPASPALMGMAGTELERAAIQHGLRFVAEAFIDRAYEPDGTLVSRKEPGAVHEQMAVATAQAVRLATEGRVTSRSGEEIAVRADTLCIHGDTPGAATKARAVRDVLESHGVAIRAHSLR